jgi:tRNA(fMet)-specific endonuclease VapC
MDAAVLDSDMLTETLKQRNTTVVANSASYLRSHGQYAFSVFTRFEVRRGLAEKKAFREVTRFDIFCSHSLVFEITDAILDRACDLWVLARQGGHPHGDADLIIAATALEHGRTLVTGNAAHFSWIPGLKLTDWRNP